MSEKDRKEEREFRIGPARIIVALPKNKKNKERKEEKELINQINNYRQLFRDSLKGKLFKDREERHKKGEVFYEGFWVPQEKLSDIQNILVKRGRTVFFEIHFLVIILILLTFLLWALFKIFLLP